MERTESRKNFVADMIIRSNANSSIIYSLYPEFGYDFDLKNEAISIYDKLHDSIVDNFQTTVVFKHAKSLHVINNIYYHRKFGWTLVSNVGKAFLGKLQKTEGSRIEIGLMSYISGSVSISGSGLVSIGSFTSIADGMEIFSSDYSHRTDLLSTYNFSGNSRIVEDNHQFDTRFEKNMGSDVVTVGSDVWLGKDVLLMNGIDIGHGAVVGARSTVTRDLAPYSINVGSPAKMIKYRVDETTISKNIDLAWWDWSLEKIIDNQKLFF